VFAVRDAPVSCETTVTDAPVITDPDLSTTVPEKLAVAWPCMTGVMQSTTVHAIARKSIL
jgi:hypothetical protein